MPDSIPIIDSSAVENLRALGDNDGGAFLREILGIYFADMPARLRELRERLAEGDQSGFTRAAHTIKGSSANVGAARVRAMAEEIEVRSRTSPIKELAGEVERLADLFDEARRELSSEMGEGKS
ncbi:Hpt domain-containing protein [Geminisphaera colitermitum]|uniref:Hpt domain-containing protein n=1 Tax=Geminisphaera colitermitum TaxID=1148786 RepID=UPI000158D12E|nr:Hpt domain-containing protein [Geminisphaera colitermitum]